MPVKVEVSDQHIQLVQLLSEGLLVREIAPKMKITQKTVEGHIYNLRQKMNVKNTQHLVGVFFRFGLLDHKFLLDREGASQMLEAYREDLLAAGSLKKDAIPSEDWFETNFPA